MISPRQYDSWPATLEELAGELEEYILRDIIRRLAKEGRITATAYIQTQSLIDYSGWTVERVQGEISRVTGLLEHEVESLYTKAVEQMQADYGGEIQKLGKPSRFLDRTYVQGLLRAEYLQTSGDFKNLTRSLGFSVALSGRREWIPLEQAYTRALNYVIAQAQSGGVTIGQAIRNATIQLSDSGLKTVEYASGHRNELSVAVRRAAVTGMHQISGQLSELAIEELGTNLVEVSAHQGARNKGGLPENHKMWQGRVYHWRQKQGPPPQKFYPDFVTTTGYGSGPGLKGWECRHDFGPYIEGVSKRLWTDEELANIDPPPFTYKGKTYETDDALDRQREIERTMRMYKRRLLGLEDAGVGADDLQYQRFAYKLKEWRQEYKVFSKAAGLREQTERARVIGFSTGQAARARAAARK